MSKLFHYTSTPGALGIIESSCLYATHFEFLNDSSELKSAINILKPKFTEVLEKKHLSEIVNAGVQDESRLDQLLKLKPSIESIFETIAEAAFKRTPVYITSFCRHNEKEQSWNDGILSQWRGYGSSGGCALEFDEEKIQKLLERECRRYVILGGRLNDVLYENYEEKFNKIDVEDLVENAYDFFVHGSEQGEKGLEDYTTKIYDLFSTIAPFIKSGAFREEGEVRISAPAARLSVLKSTSPDMCKPIYIRYKNQSPIPYIKLFEDFRPLPIERVIIGPQSNQDKARLAVEMQLEKFGYEAEVTLSNVSFIPD